MSDIGTLALLILGLLLLGGALLLLIVAGIWVSLNIMELPHIPANRRIRERLSELMAAGFAPTHQYIHAGSGVAVDGTQKRIFLANARGMKLYDIADVTKVESDYGEHNVLRFTVRDLNNPLFEVRGRAMSKATRMREIDSLVSIIRQGPIKDRQDTKATE
jgi:hypothetical protein